MYDITITAYTDSYVNTFLSLILFGTVSLYNVNDDCILFSFTRARERKSTKTE